MASDREQAELEWAEMLDAREDRVETLSDALKDLVQAVLESHRIPASRVKDTDYIYDELGSQLGSEVNWALQVLRGEEAQA